MAVWGEHLMILLKHHGIWKSIMGIIEESGLKFIVVINPLTAGVSYIRVFIFY